MNTQVESFLQKLKEEKAEIISIDYIPKEGFKVFTSKGSYTKANLPLIAKFTEEDFLEVEEKARLNIFSNLTQEVIETASETKYEIENSISEFIQKIANIKTSSNNEEENAKEILDIIGQIQEPEIKKILFKKFQTKQTNQNFEKLLKISYVDNLSTCFNSTYYHHYFGTNDIMWNRDDDIKEYNILLEMLYKHETNAVMFIDMNNFKIINDNVSHDAGDIVLQKLGCELVQEYKDLLSIRRSGDEFIVFREKGKIRRVIKLNHKSTFRTTLKLTSTRYQVAWYASSSNCFIWHTKRLNSKVC